jgi:hypothetical protein
VTLDEILACEIPEGKYKLGLKQIKDDIDLFSESHSYFKPGNKPLVDSLCASFRSEAAKGAYKNRIEALRDNGTEEGK